MDGAATRKRPTNVAAGDVAAGELGPDIWDMITQIHGDCPVKDQGQGL
jgi:hypothetical protein